MLQHDGGVAEEHHVLPRQSFMPPLHVCDGPNARTLPHFGALLDHRPKPRPAEKAQFYFLRNYFFERVFGSTNDEWGHGFCGTDLETERSRPLNLVG